VLKRREREPTAAFEHLSKKRVIQARTEESHEAFVCLRAGMVSTKEVE